MPQLALGHLIGHKPIINKNSLEEIKMKRIFLTAMSAVISTMVMGVASADTIRFWTTENQPARLAKQQEMAELPSR